MSSLGLNARTGVAAPHAAMDAQAAMIAAPPSPQIGGDGGEDAARAVSHRVRENTLTQPAIVQPTF